MHGHGYPQPVKQPPPTGWLVLLRVLFVVLSVLSIGMLAWTMLLRLAIVTRKGLDWGLFVAAMAADALALFLIGTEPGDEIHTAAGWTGMALLLGTLVAAMAYYLSADIRHFHQLRYGTGYAPGSVPAPGYGYPQAPATPYAGTTVPQTARQPVVPQPQPHHTPPPMPPAPAGIPAPPPHTPAPARIDQVRAELDELSDYLRRHDGHEGAR